MKVIKKNAKAQLPPNAATIGFFDGVHLGHRHIIGQVKHLAQERGLQTLIVTFTEHPRKVLNCDYQPTPLNTFSEKMALLGQCGVDYCCPLEFDKELAQTSSYNFMRDFLKNRLNVQLLVVGYDNHFGSDRNATFQDYVRYGKQLGIEVVQAEEYPMADQRVSSSAIRFCIQTGDVATAAQLLGHPYSITGKVVKGHQLGAKMGFPTANIDLRNVHKILPRDASYAVRVLHHDQAYAGMAYIGRRPTVSTEGERTLEIHLLHFDGNLYGHTISVQFIQQLRPERRFHSLSELEQALRHDLEETEKIVTP